MELRAFILVVEKPALIYSLSRWNQVERSSGESMKENGGSFVRGK